MFSLGETLEEWTHKKSVGDLAKSMSLNIEKVWAYRDGQEVLLKSSEVKIDDKVIIHAGNIIPFDGVIISGEAMVNEASLTGEPLSRRKYIGGYVYAGTVVEEGEIVIKVRATKDSTKYEKIVKMIEDSQKLKSNLEGKAAHLADKLVPFSLIGTGLVYLLTRNVTKAEPTVSMVIPFCNRSEDEILRIAACLEEHFPHSVAKAVVKAAKDKNLEHEEMHSKVNYIVAHGISSSIADKKAVIGSYHFVFEDEKCSFDEEYKERFKNLPEEYSHLYLAISDGAAIAREIADVTIEADDLFEIVTLKLISNSLMKRVDRNYKFIVTFNTALILLGVAGILTPTASALLHNTSTIGIAVKNMNGLLKG